MVVPGHIEKIQGARLSRLDTVGVALGHSSLGIGKAEEVGWRGLGLEIMTWRVRIGMEVGCHRWRQGVGVIEIGME